MSNQKIFNSNRKICFFLIFILQSYESALLYLASKDEDGIIQNLFLEILKKSATKYLCLCPNKSQRKMILITIFEKQSYATYFNERRKVIKREKIILDENHQTPPENIFVSIYNIDPGFSGDINFCFENDKLDPQLIEKLKSDYPEIFIDCKILSTSNLIFEDTGKFTLENKKCKCLMNEVIKQIISKEIIDFISDSLNYKDNLEVFINKSYNKVGESRTLQLFINFNYKFADTEFHWNLLKNILQHDSFGPYFVFFLDTSQYKDDLIIKSSVIEMCNKLKNVEYAEIPHDEKDECNQFVTNSLYPLIFEMKRKDKFRVIEEIIVNKLKNEHDQLLETIKNNIIKRFQYHVGLIKMIFSDDPRSSIKNKIYEWDIKYDFKGFNMYYNEVRKLIKSSKPLYQINTFSI